MDSCPPPSEHMSELVSGWEFGCLYSHWWWGRVSIHLPLSERGPPEMALGKLLGEMFVLNSSFRVWADSYHTLLQSSCKAFSLCMKAETIRPMAQNMMILCTSCLGTCYNRPGTIILRNSCLIEFPDEKWIESQSPNYMLKKNPAWIPYVFQVSVTWQTSLGSHTRHWLDVPLTAVRQLLGCSGHNSRLLCTAGCTSAVWP